MKNMFGSFCGGIVLASLICFVSASRDASAAPSPVAICTDAGCAATEDGCTAAAGYSCSCKEVAPGGVGANSCIGKTLWWWF